MNRNLIKMKLNEFLINLKNKNIIQILKNKEFDLGELEKALLIYIEIIEQIQDEELLKVIEMKIDEGIEYTNQSNFATYSHKFMNIANFLISNAPKKSEIAEENILPKTIKISEQEFSTRYHKLIEFLSFEGEESNLILEISSTKNFFKVYKTDKKHLVIHSESLQKPIFISLNSLIETAFKGLKAKTIYEKILIYKILDNSIFDSFENSSTSKDLIEVIKQKLVKNENELLIVKNQLEKIQDENQDVEEKKELFNEIFEKSKSLDSRIKAAEDKAKLGSSISYWKEKQKNHRNKFFIFSTLSIILIGVLIFVLFYLLNTHNLQINTEINSSSQSTINNDINLKKEIEVESKKITSEDLNKNSSLYLDYSKLAWFALMIFASSSALWIIRISVKIALSNLHLSEDANERVVMIQTYLSFVQEGQIEEKDKEIILTSLFRPSNIGIIKDESSVTVMDILTAFKKN